jgi:hypothetical protein
VTLHTLLSSHLTAPDAALTSISMYTAVCANTVNLYETAARSAKICNTRYSMILASICACCLQLMHRHPTMCLDVYMVTTFSLIYNAMCVFHVMFAEHHCICNRTISQCTNSKGDSIHIETSLLTYVHQAFTIRCGTQALLDKL